MEIIWQSFSELRVDTLYDILQLREAIFTFGQQCSECDIDGVDKQAWHGYILDKQQIVAYARVYEKDDKVLIGRVLVAQVARGKGLARQLMQSSLHFCREKYPKKIIKVSAQAYLEDFYASLGFVAEGDVYDEAGIPHIAMFFHG